MSETVDPLLMLTDEGRTAKMLSEGLPADRISIENGSIINACKRWPLIIDPQLQGIKWLRRKEEPNGLKVVQLTQGNWLKILITAITQGLPLLIENVADDLDATLEPVLARAVYNKVRAIRGGSPERALPPHTHGAPSHPALSRRAARCTSGSAARRWSTVRDPLCGWFTLCV